MALRCERTRTKFYKLPRRVSSWRPTLFSSNSFTEKNADKQPHDRRQTPPRRCEICSCPALGGKKKITKSSLWNEWNFFFTLSLSLASGNNLSLSDRSVHRGGKRSVQVAGTCFCLSFFLSFFFLLFFFLLFPNLTTSDPGWMCVRLLVVAGIQMRASRKPWWKHRNERGSKFRGQRPGNQKHQGWSVEQGLQTLELSPQTLSVSGSNLAWKSGLERRVEPKKKKKRNLGDDSTVASTLFEHSGRWLIINCLIK